MLVGCHLDFSQLPERTRRHLIISLAWPYHLLRTALSLITEPIKGVSVPICRHCSSIGACVEVNEINVEESVATLSSERHLALQSRSIL